MRLRWKFTALCSKRTKAMTAAVGGDGDRIANGDAAHVAPN